MNLNKKDKEVFLNELDKLNHQEEIKVCSQRCLNNFSKLGINRILVDENCMSNCSAKLLQVYQITTSNYETMTKEVNKK